MPTLKQVEDVLGGDVIEFESNGHWMGWLMVGHHSSDTALVEMLFGATKSKRLDPGGEIDEFLCMNGFEGLAAIRESFRHLWACEVEDEDEDGDGGESDPGPSFEFVRKQQPKSHPVTMMSWDRNGPHIPVPDVLPY